MIDLTGDDDADCFMQTVHEIGHVFGEVMYVATCALCDQ